MSYKHIAFSFEQNEVSPRDFEKFLDYPNDDNSWSHYGKRDSDRCLISRKPFFNNTNIQLSEQVPESFLIAMQTFNREYAEAKRIYAHDVIYSMVSEIKNKKNKGIKLSKKEAEWLKKHPNALSYDFDKLDKCDRKAKSYSEKTKSLLLENAKKGYEPAMTALATVYENGIGTEIDLIEAYAWRGVSVALHRPFGQDKLDELARKLDPFQLNKAEDLSFQYQKNYTKLFDAPTGVIWSK